MYFLALFQHGCPRVFFGKKKSMTSLCFPSGPEIRSGSISREMLMHTQEVLGELGTSFQRSVLSATHKCPSLLKATVPGRNCPHTARLLQRSTLKLPLTQADYYVRVLCLCACACACACVCVGKCGCVYVRNIVEQIK